MGHPDKVCDLISDAILDEYLRHDPMSRVAIEVQGGRKRISIQGEVTSRHEIDYFDNIVFEVFDDIGYEYSAIEWTDIWWNVSTQSPEISALADTGAGDSGIVVGYACDENEWMIPQELYYAKKIAKMFDEEVGFGPDGKVQVTMEGDKVTHIVASIQQQDNIWDIREHIWDAFEWARNANIITTPFKLGGFDADAGLTGRKIVQDQYGPQIPVGGGAFSGKDPSKVDRSGAYMARWLACREVEAMGGEVLKRYAWIIGEASPINSVTNVQGIIEELDLRKPIYYDLTKNNIMPTFL